MLRAVSGGIVQGLALAVAGLVGVLLTGACLAALVWALVRLATTVG